RRRHTRFSRDWSSDVCSSDLDYRKIVIDLGNTDSEKLSFQYRNPDSQRWVSIQDLLSAEIFTIYNQLPNDDYKRRFERYRNLLRSEERRVGKESKVRQ